MNILIKLWNFLNNSHVVFGDSQFKSAITEDDNLRITEAYNSENILISIFVLIGLFLFSFVGLTSMEQHNPKAFFQGWLFISAVIVVLLVLINVWYKGHVLFNNTKGIITLKLNKNKFFGRTQISYEDVAGMRLKINERMAKESEKIYQVYHFSILLKTGKSVKLLTVYKKSQGSQMKRTISDYMNYEIKERFIPLF